MNDEPRRLVDEDPDGAASALIRAALQDGPPPPLGAKTGSPRNWVLPERRLLPFGNDVLRYGRWLQALPRSLRPPCCSYCRSALKIVHLRRQFPQCRWPRRPRLHRKSSIRPRRLRQRPSCLRRLRHRPCGRSIRRRTSPWVRVPRQRRRHLCGNK